MRLQFDATDLKKHEGNVGWSTIEQTGPLHAFRSPRGGCFTRPVTNRPATADHPTVWLVANATVYSLLATSYCLLSTVY